MIGTSTAFAQSQPAAAPAAGASGAAAAAAPAAASGAAATSAKNGKVQQIKRFEVTGSLIRSSDKVGYNQVQTVSAKQIQDSGQTTVADFLRSTAANSANSWSEGQAGNFAAGAAGMALRGLSEKYTLVMVDGQRVAPFAFFSNSVDQFFDINTIPTDMIDRIEIVKTGAVSQYGSDAVAGVVNIITKKDFQGLQLDGSIGSSVSNGNGNGTGKFGVLGGFGNLTSDGYNVTVAASAYKDNGSTLADRDSTRNQDFTNQPGGFSLLAPSYWGVGGSATAGGGTPQALSNCAYGGHVTSAANNYVTGQAVGLSNALGATPPLLNPGGTVCGFNTASQLSIAPLSERDNLKLHADFKLNDTTTAYGDFWVSDNRTTSNDGTWGNTVGSPTSPALIYNPATKGYTVFNNTVSALNPYNPFGVDTPLTYTFPNTVTEQTNASFWRAATGVKGQFNLPNGEWDWATSVGHSQSIVSNTYNNQLNVNALSNIYGATGGFNFENPSATPNGLAGLYQNASIIGVSKLDTVDATLSTPTLFHLPAGDVGLGLGAQFMHESEVISPGSEFLQGQVINPNLQEVNGNRNIGAVYYQVDVPIIQHLSFSTSGRYDHYSDVGGAFSPRFALRFQPVQQLTLYGSYDRGFRAPTFVENTASQTVGLQIEPTGNVTTITQGNPNLQPERTKNYNIGFQLAATKTTDIGVDWYKIHIDNVIGQGAQTEYNGNPNVFQIPYANLGTLDTSGFETTFRQALPTKIGTFTLSADWAYVYRFLFQDPNLGPGNFNGAGNNLTLAEPFGGSFPRWKGNTSLSWAYHQWSGTFTWNYTGPYTQDIAPLGMPTNNTGSTPSYSVFNFVATYTGFKHWTIYGGVDNIFNRTPPFDPAFASSSLDQSGYDTSLYNYLGRFAQIGATYKF